MSEFVIHLPSNVQPNRFPLNNASNYSTQLDYSIDLDNEWEVALVEVTYLRSVIMFQDEGIKFAYMREGKKKKKMESYWKLPSPRDNTYEALLSVLNEKYRVWL